MKQIRKRLTYANAMSSIAVFLVLGGATAIAASQIDKKSIGTPQLKSNAVTTAKIKKNAVTKKKIAKEAINASKVKKDSLTGNQINESTLGTVPSANTANVASNVNGYNRKGIIRLGATAGAAEAAAREAAPETALFTAGPLSFYAKCFTYGTTVKGEMFIRTSANGAIFDGENESAEGEPFLNTGTDEEDRSVAYESTGAAPSASLLEQSNIDFWAMAPDGTSVLGNILIAVRNGDLAEGNGVYGAGACLFSGELTSLSS